MGGTSVGPSIDLSFAFNSGTDFSAWQPGNSWSSDFFGFTPTVGSRNFTTYSRGVSGSSNLSPGLGIVASDLVGSVWTPDQTWTANGQSFASIGLDLGTYTVSDAVSGESITFQIGAVPEPSSVLLMGLGGMLIMSRTRRNK